MVESHAPVNAMQGSEDVAHDVDGGHGGVGCEAGYGPVVVEQVS